MEVNISQITGPAAATVSTEEDLSSLQDTSDVFVLGSFSSVESDGYKAFMKLAASDDLNTYVVTTSDAIKTKLAMYVNSIICRVILTYLQLYSA